MSAFKFALLIVTALAAPLVSGSANAAVITYTLTFNDPDGGGPKTGGTGFLTLDVAAIPGTLNIGSGSPEFVGMTATVNGETFTFTDIWSIGFTAGVLNNLSAASPTN